MRILGNVYVGQGTAQGDLEEVVGIIDISTVLSIAVLASRSTAPPCHTPLSPLYSVLRSWSS